MSGQLVGERLHGRANALNAVRLALALLVVVGHSWPLSGSPWPGGPQLAGLAVSGFFALSGYLIAQSRDRLPLLAFLRHRMARILPAFWVCLVVVALLFAPLVTLRTREHFELMSALDYIRGNALLFIGQWGIDSTLMRVPYPGVWNGSLWTLWYEAIAYVCAGLFLVARVRRAAPVALPALALALCALVVVVHGPFDGGSPFTHHGLRLLATFAAGAAMWALRHQLRSNHLVGIACLLFAVVATFTLPPAWGYALTAAPLAYGLVWLGATLPSGVFQTNDVSYGTYVYSFPVQQVLAAFGAATLGVVGFAAVSIAATMPFAVASWFLVERPVLRRTRRRSSATAAERPSPAEVLAPR
ncbi:acyltransferase family protein [Oryzobacter telluris]|uniref:acyltransferase family protein n=1 Tax=Oryzobacter telluris TaxID=3149179 RepID=UPI00370DDF4E